MHATQILNKTEEQHPNAVLLLHDPQSLLHVASSRSRAGAVSRVRAIEAAFNALTLTLCFRKRVCTRRLLEDADEDAAYLPC